MRNRGHNIYWFFFLAAAALLAACPLLEDSQDDSSGGSISVTVSPASVTLAKGTSQQFSAEVSNTYSQSVAWSIEGDHAAGTAISREGLLTVAGTETARTFKVKATYSSWDDTASGTATVTIATGAELPSNLRITQPQKTALNLSWNAAENTSAYKIYRSTNGKDYAHLTDTTSNAYSDTAIAAGSSYYYAVSAVVKGLETGKSSAAFGFAEDYFALPVFVNRRLVPLAAGQIHYYRFPVNAGESYSITWENGSSGEADYYVRCSAWQNDGTEIFGNANYGYKDPKVFTASITGYVTVEIKNINGSARYNYMAYCLKTNGENDAGVVALPPAPLTGIKVTAPTSSSVALSWDAADGAVSYNIYRGTTQAAAPGLIGSSTSADYQDNSLAPNTSYYYTVAPVNAEGREGVRVQGAFAFTVAHYALQGYSGSPLMSLAAGQKNYYRFPVISGQSYTITWEDGNSANANYYIRCSAWQNNGTEIFGNANDGYSSPKAFTASMAGYITVEVKNISGSTGYNYKIYCQ